MTRVETGVRADRGAVAAGRDVVASLLVTGNSNIFFLGGYQRLEEAYIDPRRSSIASTSTASLAGSGWTRRWTGS